MKGLVVILAGGALVVGLLVSTAMAGGARGPGDISRADLQGVNFIESCRLSHRAPDDPIVFPGKPGASHEHTFVGNSTTNAFSTYGSLRSSETTCERAARHRGVLGADALSGCDRHTAAGERRSTTGAGRSRP